MKTFYRSKPFIISIIFLTLNLMPNPLLADYVKKDNHIFYHKKSYGSSANLDPINYYLNAAFDTIQNPWHFSQENYFEKHKTVWNRIKSPIHSIKKDGGFKKFFLDEFTSIRALPNWTIHLLGYGYDYRILAEWFEYHGYLYPRLFSALVLYAAHLGNEAIESTDEKDISSHDHIADLFFFDLASIILFESDTISKFFHEKLQFRNWYFQPMFDIKNSHIRNAGTNYILRPRLFGDNILVFGYLGLQVMGGLSFLIDTNTYFTFAGGMAITSPMNYEGRPVVGFFIDKNDSLLSSLIINGTDNLKIRFNLYPGIVKIKNLKIGIFSALNHQNSIYLGISVHSPVGITTYI